MDVVQVGVAERHQAREGTPPADYVADGHLLARVAGRRRRPGLYLASVVGYDVLAEPELAFVHSINRVGPFHVLVNLRKRHQEVQVKHQEHSREQHHKSRERCILEISQLHLHGTELGAPTNVRRTHFLRRGRLPAHGLPIRGIEALEMLHGSLVVHFRDGALEGHQRVAHEKVRQVPREGPVDALAHEEGQGLLVDLARHVVVVARGFV
mmetsp:Transcript_96411/g.294895  ORF Transcript_96411/g.294895 Transcript_96411/m.294895 type:complete len:210 (+) Transcript_96411:505-1134(+)